MLIICFPFAALLLNRDGIRNSWLGKYPNSMQLANESLEKVWQWAFSDIDTTADTTGTTSTLDEDAIKAFTAFAICILVGGGVGYGVGNFLGHSCLGASTGIFLALYLLKG